MNAGATSTVLTLRVSHRRPGFGPEAKRVPFGGRVERGLVQRQQCDLLWAWISSTAQLLRLLAPSRSRRGWQSRQAIVAGRRPQMVTVVGRSEGILCICVLRMLYTYTRRDVSVHVCEIVVCHTQTKVHTQRRAMVLKQNLICRDGHFDSPELWPSKR
jgi:hypothetical protein